jgi:hypothetical protein
VSRVGAWGAKSGGQSSAAHVRHRWLSSGFEGRFSNDVSTASFRPLNRNPPPPLPLNRSIWFALYRPNPTPSATPTATATQTSSATSTATGTVSVSNSNTRTSTATRSATASATATATPSATASATVSPTASGSASATGSATHTMNATIAAAPVPNDPTPAIVGASVGGVAVVLLAGAAAFVGVRLAWQGRGPFARCIRHGPKQWKDRSVGARLERRLSGLRAAHGVGPGVAAGTYAAKHPGAAPGAALASIADAYAAVYGGGSGDVVADAAVPVDPDAGASRPPVDLAAGAAAAAVGEWGSSRRLGAANAAAGATAPHSKTRFAPMASGRGLGGIAGGPPAAGDVRPVETTNPAAGRM